MPMQNSVGLLKHLGLHITEPRKMILQAFISEQNALTQREVKKYCGSQFDRVTIYRTLGLFIQYHIIHILPSSDNVIRYALMSDTEGNVSSDNHLHFICEGCHRTYCLKHIKTPALTLPEGFAVRHTEVVLKGTCNNCLDHHQKKHKNSYDNL